MLYGTLLSTALIAASSFVYATPLLTKEKLAEKAKVIPFVNKHAAAWKSENYSPLAVSKRDLHRIQQRIERIAAVKRSGEKVTNSKRKAAALEPYDIGDVRRAAMKKRQGSFASYPLVNVQDGLYYGNLSVGTPAQVTTVDFDTGSADLIIPSSDCTTCVGPFYNPSISTSFTNRNSAFQTSFVDGSAASGILATENISLGGLSVANQSFAIITGSTGNFDGPNSGLMGLAFPSIAQTKATPWFFNLANQGSLASNVFSFYMTRQGADGSELCIGCIDSTKYTGQPEWFPLYAGNGTQAVWDIISDGATYNNAVVTQPLAAIIDSGTSAIYIPPSQAAALYANIPGAQLYTDSKHYVFPCSSVATIGQVGFTFRGSSSVFNIQPSQFSLGPIETGSDSEWCSGAIVSSGLEDSVATVGDAFMSSWYSIFDFGNMRVGFAQAV
ncbi:Type I transmembrane sorting receptor [Tulasnella sp. 408]|nr:Type I transmembrane sorting receptor [Tulasnella sp. 408]